MSAKNDKNKIRKTLLTPCRRVGLKRKSLDNTPRGRTPSTPVINVDTSSLSVESNSSATPTRHFVDSMVETSVRLESSNYVTPVRHVSDDTSASQLEKKLKLDRIKVKKILDNSPNKEITTVDDFVESENEINSQINQIKRRISEKTAEVNILKSECKNVKQHDLKTLTSLINKWRYGCQTALKELLREYESRGRSCTMSVLLRTLGVPSELVHFSEAEMDFQD